MNAFTQHPVGFVYGGMAFLGLVAIGNPHAEVLSSDTQDIGQCMEVSGDQAHPHARTQDPSYGCTRRQAFPCMALSCIPLRLHCLDWAIHSFQEPSP